ncbi:hypothetical protein FACS1894171_2310 [Clostridia bacterium]|nr:hypothetical protein FACS1894171_2310 [Clostridia bacterium]
MSAIVLTSTEGMPREKWLDWRRKGIGGSDASIVCGISQYKTPVELFMEKTGQSPPGRSRRSCVLGHTA